MKKLAVCFIVLMILTLALDTSARKKRSKKIEEISYLEHQKVVNRVICDKYVECNMAFDAASCTERLNGVTASTPYYTSAMIYKHRSEMCHKYLTEDTTCEDISARSVEGPCNSNELKKR